MELSDEKLKEMLVEPGHVTEEDFELAQEQAEEKDRELTRVLINKGLIKDEQLGTLIANEIGKQFVNLEDKNIPEEIINIVPVLVAKNQGVVAFDRDQEGLHVATVQPENYELKKWLKKKTGEKVNFYYTTWRSISEALEFYKKGLEREFDDIINEEVGKVQEGAKKAPVIRIVETLIDYAYMNEASDIHIEPLEEKTRIRFRIDGVLHDVADLPKDLHDLIVTRIKVLAELRTDEHHAAQDGKFRVEPPEDSSEDKSFDIRVSVVPIVEGEKVVMRLLSEKTRQFTLGSLGLNDEGLEKVKKAAKNPYGMILATGPTGSGKTTTLYSIVKLLNDPGVNISTIEDPVEYDVKGINQIQVNPETNLTFAEGLRSIVRQDPDIIMVGEIRDKETAGIAVNSAMTGHLVLSTMHANTAATNLPRLTDMGVEPFLVTSSVNLIIAQRLVRKICSNCKRSTEVEREELKRLGFSEEMIKKELGDKKKLRVYEGAGCDDCSQTGYSGRVGVFEILEVKENIKDLILEQASSDEIEKQAIKNGMTTMVEDGLKKVKRGITSVEEVARVIKA